jgi:hypothetical protein
MRWAGNPLRVFFLMEGWLPANFSGAGSRLIAPESSVAEWGGPIYFCKLTAASFNRYCRFFSGGFLYFPGDRIRSVWTSLLG